MTAMVAREAVDRALENGRRSYYALWATEDAHEAMQSFIEKRAPVFVGR